MKNIFLSIFACAASLFGTMHAESQELAQAPHQRSAQFGQTVSSDSEEKSGLKIGYVNFKACLEKSKVGQEERNAFEALKKQMSETLEKTDKELNEIAKKLEDQDYMDGLSPTAENELKQRFQSISQEMARYQNQSYQILNQANFKLIQHLHEYVSHAAEKVRNEHRLSLILNEESTFALSPSLDYTAAVIEEMDRRTEQENNENHS